MINNIQTNNYGNTSIKKDINKNKNSQEAHPYSGSNVVSLNAVNALKAIAFAGINEIVPKKFSNAATVEGSQKWEQAISRVFNIYQHNNEIRSEFKRDRDRITNSEGYNRLGRKTQVWMSPKDPHVCKRSDHVQLVASISEDICNALGLNSELARAIALGHDVGHAPFGHNGEHTLNDLAKQHGIERFWHEQNSLRFIDKFETLLNPDGEHQTLNLTYAVRDGIISHCGEVNQNGIKPRDEAIDLYEIKNPGQTQPYTWEGCVVKIADKIAYLGRDIEDALKIGELSREKLERELPGANNTTLIGTFVKDIIENSSPEEGIKLSDKKFELMKKAMKFNYENIYKANKTGSHRKKAQEDYQVLVIETLFDTLSDLYDKDNAEQGTLRNIRQLKDKKKYPQLCGYFEDWLIKYSKIDPEKRKERKFSEIQPVYNLKKPEQYKQAVVDYIAGMTDNFAQDCFHEIRDI